MTTALVTAKSGEKVKKVVDRLSEARAHGADLDAVAVVDSDGRLLGDVTVLDILLALRAVHRHAHVRAPRRRGRGDGQPARRRRTRWRGSWSRRGAIPWWSSTTTGARSGASWPTTSSMRSCPTKGRFHFPRLSVMRVAGPAAAVADLPGRRRARADRGGRRQRRRWHRHLLVGRGAVRLPHPLLDGADHGGLRHRPGDGGPPGRPHRQGSGRPDPGGVRPPPHRLRHHGLRHRQRRADGHRVRRHRHLLRVVQRLALHLGAHRRRGHLVARALRLLPLRRAGLPAPHPRVHRLSDRRRAGPSQLARGGGQHGVAPLRRLEVVPLAVGRAHRHHHHPLHPALRSGCRGRQGRQARAVPLPAGRRDHRRRARRVRRHVDHRGHRRHHRGHGPAHLGHTAAEGLKPVAGAFATTLFGLGLLGASALAAAVVPAVDLLRRGRGDRGRALGLVELPPGPRLPRHLHLPDPRSAPPWCSSRAT